MITTSYNPSKIEQDLAAALPKILDQLNGQLKDFSIDKMEEIGSRDNPHMKLDITDNDGDKHEVIIKIIQRPDERINE